jgi:hypothetical protein
LRFVDVTCAAVRLIAQRMPAHPAGLLPRKEQPMLDVILLAVGLGFFALSVAYAYGCDRL